MFTLYSPLNEESYEVRMLTFPPANSSPMVECTMRTISLFRSPPPRYVALSYCWGDANITTNVYINGSTVPVTLNLEAALQRLRRTLDTDIMVWADALCINQKDKRERGQQVRLMTQIYSKAETCHAWLGGFGSEGAEAGIRSMVRLDGSRSNLDKIQKDELLRAACLGFLSFCRCQYWRRRWIIQELTAAQDVQIMCLNETVSFEVIRSVYTSCSRSEFWLFEHKLVAAPFDQIVKFRLAYHEEQLPSLPSAIFQTQQFRSQDERDRIFSLIGICEDGVTLVPAPNYTQSTNEISRDLTRALLRRNANFDLVYQSGRFREGSASQVSLPTWASDWCSKDLPAAIIDIVTAESTWPRSIAASALRGDPNMLQMEGYTLGTIITLSSPLSRDVSPHGTTLAQTDLKDRPCKYYGSNTMAFFALSQLLFTDQVYIFMSRVRMSICRGLYLYRYQRPEQFHVAFYQCFRNNEPFFNDGQPLKSFSGTYYVALLVVGLLVKSSLFLSVAFSVEVYFTIKSLSEIRSGTAVGVGTILFVTGIVTFFGMLFKFVKIGSTVRAIIRTQTKPRVLFAPTVDNAHCIYILDSGMLGRTRSCMRVGDKVCRLVGCREALILRATTCEDSALYTVVERTAIALNSAEGIKSKLITAVMINKHTPRTIREEWTKKLEQLRANDWYETFTLI